MRKSALAFAESCAAVARPIDRTQPSPTVLEELRARRASAVRLYCRDGVWSVYFDLELIEGWNPWDCVLPVVPPCRTRQEVERWLVRVQHGVGYSIPAKWEVG